jgi:beta-lactamase superfamily II metal-dependent hydrolase
VTTGDFLRAVAPSAIVSSNDHTLTRKQRQFERIAAPYRLYRTERDGAVTVTVSGGGAIDVRTFASR